ncbi:MAG: chorismate mutase [Actinobacteria bacterium]|nr:chorismate mutase [Actinomycetota bacterium]MCL6105386.1 chorismate mutase [Actinomycetota bacterium]
MNSRVMAIRGATTLDMDTPDQVNARVSELLGQIMERNNLTSDDFVSIIFTATEDIVSMFPATAARHMGLDDVPMMCAKELSISDSKYGLARCIRLLAHVYATVEKQQVHHVYLHRAAALRSFDNHQSRRR